jgi:ADP-heptose:LPS heptosyltransferase
MGKAPPSPEPPAGAKAGSRILVIKLGALGDFIQALGPMKAVRDHHGAARITLLTTAPLAELGRASGYFDEVWIDGRPGLRAGSFDRVYDLQTSDRSGAYFRLMRRRSGDGGPEWSGVARGCSHRHDSPARDSMHTAERQTEQLKGAGIAEVPPPDLSFLDAEVGRFALDGPYAVLVPAGAAHRPGKRWPAESYGALARGLAESGMTPVMLGAAAERPLTAHIRALCPAARDLAGATSLAEVAALARGARAAVGNDTGPMHIIAAVGCPAVVLFSSDSDPALCAPRGPAVTVLRRERLSALGVDEVWAALDRLGGAAAQP